MNGSEVELNDFSDFQTKWYIRIPQNHIILIVAISMGDCNTILSAYTLYRHLG